MQKLPKRWQPLWADAWEFAILFAGCIMLLVIFIVVALTWNATVHP